MRSGTAARLPFKCILWPNEGAEQCRHAEIPFTCSRRALLANRELTEEALDCEAALAHRYASLEALPSLQRTQYHRAGRHLLNARWKVIPGLLEQAICPSELSGG